MPPSSRGNSTNASPNVKAAAKHARGRAPKARPAAKRGAKGPRKGQGRAETGAVGQALAAMGMGGLACGGGMYGASMLGGEMMAQLQAGLQPEQMVQLQAGFAGDGLQLVPPLHDSLHQPGFAPAVGSLLGPAATAGDGMAGRSRRNNAGVARSRD